MNQSILHIQPERPRQVYDEVERAATLELPDGTRQRLWYRVPDRWASGMSDRLEPFAIATAFFAMQRGAKLFIHGEASPVLLRNLEEFQAVWHCWKPERYRPVEIVADRERGPEPAAKDHAIACFSGGVDGSFTTYRHAKQLCGRLRRDIRAGLLVHHDRGVAKRDDKEFGCAAEKAAKMLNDLGLPLITLSTNWRSVAGEGGLKWSDAHGAAYIACLMLFSAKFGCGLIGSTNPYSDLIPWGSNPVTDPLLSSETFAIVHDGAAATRMDKVAMIAGWPEALANLRVCWEGKDRSRNCGACEKCIRTILNFRAAGCELPPCFEADVTDEQIGGIAIRNLTQRNQLQSILDHALAQGWSDRSWVRALDRRLRRAEQGTPLWRRMGEPAAWGSRLRRIVRGVPGGRRVARLGRRVGAKQTPRFRAFGVGTAKSGTVSLSELFGNYRARHEVGGEAFVERLLGYLDGTISRRELVRVLKDHGTDRIEMNAAHFQVYYLDVLLERFPEAKFILTIRDCFSWVDSFIDHQVNHPKAPADPPPAWVRFRDYRFGPPARGIPEERALADRGLYSLDGYFAYWAMHNQRVLDTVPEDRLMVVRTGEIGKRMDDLARFVGVRAESLRPAGAHSHRAKSKHRIVAEMDPDYVRAIAARHCGELMRRFFPEVRCGRAEAPLSGSDRGP